ncbi:MAG: 3'(2'),5'-bisphosphate nucleotidase CysQ [Nitrospira sp.]|nr:3'(2'),5'-bisphosphate nucleotidase CysQ [Nitrospira sp.]
MSDFSKEIKVASDLALKAGQSILQIYAQDFSITYKNPNDPVTDADHKANTIIVKGFQEHFPDDIVVAEESPLPESPTLSGRVWYVDPLDGTKEFIGKNGEFSIMIGLAIDGIAQCGVVYWPTKGQLFGGIRNQTAWKEENGNRVILTATHARDLNHLSLVASRSHRSSSLDHLKQSLNVQQEYRMGSVGLKIAFIAQGGADFYTEPGPYTRAWDACAPEAILRGAGGIFTDVHGNDLHYGNHDFRNIHGIVATTGDCHTQVIKAVAPLCSCHKS